MADDINLFERRPFWRRLQTVKQRSRWSASYPHDLNESGLEVKSSVKTFLQLLKQKNILNDEDLNNEKKRIIVRAIQLG